MTSWYRRYTERSGQGSMTNTLISSGKKFQIAEWLIPLLSFGITDSFSNSFSPMQRWSHISNSL